MNEISLLLTAVVTLSQMGVAFAHSLVLFPLIWVIVEGKEVTFPLYVVISLQTHTIVISSYCVVTLSQQMVALPHLAVKGYVRKYNRQMR